MKKWILWTVMVYSMFGTAIYADSYTLQYDDDSPEQSISPWSDESGSEIAVKFSPLSYPVKISKVIINFGTTPDIGTAFHIRVYNTIDGFPGEQLDHTNALYQVYRGGWLEFDLSREDILISEGDFFISLYWTTPTGLDGSEARTLQADNSDIAYNRTYMKGGTSGNWHHSDANAMIRTEVQDIEIKENISQLYDFVSSNELSDWKFCGTDWEPTEGNLRTVVNKDTYAFLNKQFADFELTARIKSSGNRYSDYGILFRAKQNCDAFEGYFFKIDNGGSTGFYRQGSFGNQSISKGNRQCVRTYDWNELRVIAKGSAFDFFVNGILVESYEYKDFSTGSVGIGMMPYNENDAELLIDWLEIKAGHEPSGSPPVVNSMDIDYTSNSSKTTVSVTCNAYDPDADQLYYHFIWGNGYRSGPSSDNVSQKSYIGPGPQEESVKCIVTDQEGLKTVETKIFGSGVLQDAQISGHVRDNFGAALRNVYVRTYDVDSFSIIEETLTDQYGFYSISLPPGTYFICAYIHSFYVQEFYDGAYEPSESTPVTFLEGAEMNNIDFSLDAGGIISGTVTKGNHVDNFDNIHVYFEWEKDNGETITWYNYLENDGTFASGHGFPEGRYRVYVVDANTNKIIKYYGDTIDRASAEIVTVTAGVVTNGIDIHIDKTESAATPEIEIIYPTSASTFTLNERIDFQSTAQDPDGSIVSYHWDFGDGCKAITEQNPTYQYSEEGNFTVKVTVTDNDGNTASDSVTIHVESASQGDNPEIIVEHIADQSFEPFYIHGESVEEEIELSVNNYDQDMVVTLVVAESDNHDNVIYDSHSANEDIPVSPNDEKQIHKFSFTIPDDAATGNYDMIAAVRESSWASGNNNAQLLDVTGNGADSGFENGSWQKKIFQIKSIADVVKINSVKLYARKNAYTEEKNPTSDPSTEYYLPWLDTSFSNGSFEPMRPVIAMDNISQRSLRDLQIKVKFIAQTDNSDFFFTMKRLDTYTHDNEKYFDLQTDSERTLFIAYHYFTKDSSPGIDSSKKDFRFPDVYAEAYAGNSKNKKQHYIPYNMEIECKHKNASTYTVLKKYDGRSYQDDDARLTFNGFGWDAPPEPKTPYVLHIVKNHGSTEDYFDEFKESYGLVPEFENFFVNADMCLQGIWNRYTGNEKGYDKIYDEEIRQYMHRNNAEQPSTLYSFKKILSFMLDMGIGGIPILDALDDIESVSNGIQCMLKVDAFGRELNTCIVTWKRCYDQGNTGYESENQYIFDMYEKNYLEHCKESIWPWNDTEECQECNCYDSEGNDLIENTATLNLTFSDIDGDGDTDHEDISVLQSFRNNPSSVCPACDLNNDGIISDLDEEKILLINTFNISSNRLHVNNLELSGTSYWFDMALNENFQLLLTDLGMNEDSGGKFLSLSSAIFNADELTLHIPIFYIENKSYWIDLKFVSSTPNLTFQIEDFGKN